MQDVATVWSSERLVMRFEAFLSARPSSAVHWRSQAALAEAACSAQSEGKHFDPPSLLLALLHRTTEPDHSNSDTVRFAELIWRCLTTASGSNADFKAAAAISTNGQEGPGNQEHSQKLLNEPERMKWAIEQLQNLGGLTSLPLLPRLAIVPNIYREASGRPSPVAERLWMALADDMWRRSDDTLFPTRATKQFQGKLLLERPLEARWILAPASLFSVGKYRLWQPDSSDFQDHFLQNADLWLRQQLENLLKIARWEDNELADFAKAGKVGARGELAQLVKNVPVFDVSLVARQLQVHERTARRILNEATEASVIVEIIGSYRNRIWAAPCLAEWAHSVRKEKRLRKATTAPSVASTPPAAMWVDGRAARDARLQALMDDLDALSKGVLNLTGATHFQMNGDRKP